MSEAAGSHGLFAALKEGERRVLIAGFIVVLCLAAFAALFTQEAIGAFRVWEDSRTFNHCFLVLPLSLFLLWQRRQDLENLRATPDWRAVPVMLGVSFVWLAASVAGILEARQLVVMTMVQVALFGIFGAAFYRRAAAPFLYLYFLVPSGEFLIPALQAFTARFAVLGLHILAIPVFSNGAVIEIPAGTFVVAEACAGLRFLVAAVAFGVFFSVLTYRSWLKRTVFIAFSIVVPIIANGFRALGLIAAAEWIGNATAALADHILYGWIFFSLILVLLVWIGQMFSDMHESEGDQSAAPAAGPAMLSAWTAFAGVACFLAAAAGPVSGAFLDMGQAVSVPQAAPVVAPPWRRIASTSDWRPILVQPTRIYFDTFADGGDTIDRFIALYGEEGRGNNLVRSSNRDADEEKWSFNAARNGSLLVDGRAVPARVTTWISGSKKRIVWSFYVVNGRPAGTAWGAKRDQLVGYFTANHCVPAYVALSSQNPDEAAAANAAARLLAASEPLASYLCGSTKDQARR